MSEKFWYKVARIFIKAGRLPLPVNNAVIEILKDVIDRRTSKLRFIV